ncbi:MAG: efflux RND transporter periplasmic adaptor subunit [Hyphomicrobiaceae bacterium]
MKSLLTKLVGLLLAVVLGTYILAPDLFKRGSVNMHPVSAGEAAVKPSGPIVPAVTIVRAETRPVVESVIVSGTLVPREEILVAAEVDGLSISELLVEEGAWVEKGQVLAHLNKATLEAQLAQNAAQIARADAAIAQAKAQIAEAAATVSSSEKARTRARKLAKSGYGSEATLDQAVSANEVAEARVAAAEKLVEAAQADKAVAEAQRRELEWRMARTDIIAPSSGLVSRRTARVGQIAGMAGEPMFRLIADGEIELEAEVADVDLPRIEAGQVAIVTPAGFPEPVNGTVRLVMPEIDRVTRLGKARIALDKDKGLAVGGFAKGIIEIARRDSLIVPLSAVSYQDGKASVQVVADDTVRSRAVSIGYVDGDVAEIQSGLTKDEVIVLKAGTFLREGDKVKPTEPFAKTAGQ